MSGAKQHNAEQDGSSGIAVGGLTKRNLPKEYGPLRNGVFLLFFTVVMLPFGAAMGAYSRPALWPAFAFGLSLGVVCGLAFVRVWMKNAAHFLCLPPNGSTGNVGEGLLRFVSEWRMPEARQTILAAVLGTLPVGLFGIYFIKRFGSKSGGISALGPPILSSVSFFIIWAIGYLIWWRRLPSE